jgi:hypothetical protein
MDPQQASHRAPNLAGQVLRREICLDEGLLLASASDVFTAFIDNLNVLSGGNFFDQSELDRRVKSGEAQFAMEGRTPRLEIPTGLGPGESQEQTSAAEGDSFLDKMNTGVLQCREAQAEILREISFLETVRGNRPKPPSPWLAGVILMILAMVVTGIALAAAGSPISALAAFVLLSAMAGFVTLNNMKEFENFIRLAREEDERWKRKLESFEMTLSEMETQAENLQKEAQKTLSRLDESEARQVRLSNPQLFPAADSPPPE